ncbi:MAG TPA: hypothetical protein PLA43_09965 [Bryobacteraceae bacterium]|nr:hypothetical protein [Bryobacteraceae bacterium]HOL72125.1 hypothetical protein [Bryobacteraceae bacterium]HOQ46291.1 hypothetical protein [Bryobacteraceae bacterium]HPQ14228.1 hypothetical protein [Bryobacteraceae bacterium]HPU72272.1 hypothetical protein [Bryobacteraceae bacterium]
MEAAISNRSFFAIAGAIAAFAAGEVLFFNAISNLCDESRKIQQSIVSEISKVREGTLMANQEHAVQVERLRKDLTAAREQTTRAAEQVSADAQRHAELLAINLARQVNATSQQVARELMNVRAAAAAASAAAGELTGEVRNTQVGIAAAQAGIEQTSEELNGVSGRLGPMRDAIAAESREVAALKARGERRIFEFALVKSVRREVAGVMIRLRKTDPRRNRYSVELTADGRAIEHTDRTVNEPVRFLAKGRQPYELVVHRVADNRIEGYLAAPATY